VLVHTGQNYDYETERNLFQELGVPRPKHYLNAAGRNAAETIGKTIAKADRGAGKEQPRPRCWCWATPNSCLAVIPAKRRKTPFFTWRLATGVLTWRVPEEINRRIVDHVSDINLCYTRHGRRYLLAEGLAVGPGHENRIAHEGKFWIITVPPLAPPRFINA